MSLSTGLLDVTFDRPLRTQPTLAMQWTAVANFLQWGTMVNGSALGTHVTITLTSGPADIGPDTFSYSAAAADVVSSSGIPAAPIIDYPLVTTP
jgi:hypothetical protein